MSRNPSLVAPEVQEWVEKGRTDIALFSEKGLGIKLHRAQLELAQAIVNAMIGEEEAAAYYLLTWANRAGKTTVILVIHLWVLFYKPGLPPPATEKEYKQWLSEDYRTLHCAPLNELAGRAWLALGDIINGTSKAQRDPETGKRRSGPLAAMFSATKERTETGSDKMFLRCLTGGVMDFRSTEGKAARVEGGAWRLITWDEWPSTENADDIRFVLYNRLTARASDYDAPIVLTGTITPDTEHIAKEFLAYAEDKGNPDWWGNTASRAMNPSTSQKAIDRALRNLDPEDYARSVDGMPGGVKGRLFPSWLVDPCFRNDLPGWQRPDKANGEGGAPKWRYVTVCDLAISQADNVILIGRVPFDWRFSVKEPVVGVSLKIIPGSRTLIDDEIEFAIEETWLPYGGDIYLDTTDAHGTGIYRSMRRRGLPVREFNFKDPDALKVTRKWRAIRAVRAMLAEGINPERDTAGEPVHDADGMAAFDKGQPYGSLKLPAAWVKPKDQLSIVKPPPDDEKQTKDAAMAVYMLCEVCYRERRAATRVHRITRASFNRSGRLYAGQQTTRIDRVAR